VLEPHGFAGLAQLFEFCWPVESVDGQMPKGGTQVLADGQQVAINLAQVGHGLQNLIDGLAHAHDNPRLGDCGGVNVLGFGQQIQGKFVASLGPHLGEDAHGGLNVVVQNGGSSFDDPAQSSPRPREIRYQNLDPAVWAGLFDFVDARREDVRAAVREVVPVYRGDNAVAQPHRLDDLSQAPGFLQVQALGPARGHCAVPATPGADLAQNHERGSAPVPAFSDVGAVGFFADSVELLVFHQVLELKIARAAWHRYLEPFGKTRPDLKVFRALGHRVSSQWTCSPGVCNAILCFR
ncbi:uncharacterized protein METZ01_LOCUS27669, partial [marine metagenome]